MKKPSKDEEILMLGYAAGGNENENARPTGAEVAEVGLIGDRQGDDGTHRIVEAREVVPDHAVNGRSMHERLRTEPDEGQWPLEMVSSTVPSWSMRVDASWADARPPKRLAPLVGAALSEACESWLLGCWGITVEGTNLPASRCALMALEDASCDLSVEGRDGTGCWHVTGVFESAGALAVSVSVDEAAAFLLRRRSFVSLEPDGCDGLMTLSVTGRLCAYVDFWIDEDAGSVEWVDALADFDVAGADHASGCAS